MNDLVAERARIRSVSLSDPAVLTTSSPSVMVGRGSGSLSASGFAGLFQAIGALRNGAALTALSGCLIAGLLLNGFLSTLGGHSSVFLSVLGALCIFVAAATGINAAGVLLLEQAKRAPRHKVQGAIVHGLMCVPKCLVLGLALLSVAVVVVAALACTYLLCRVPLFGPLAFVVVFPLSVAAAGVTFGALSLCLFLALPPIWEGASLSASIAQALAIARARLIESFLLMAAVGGLTLAVSCVVFGVLLAGLLPMLTLSTTVFGTDALPALGALLLAGYSAGGFIGEGAAVDYSVAMALGGGLLLALAGSLVALVPLLGLSLVYLRVSEGHGEFGARRRPATGGNGDAAAPAAGGRGLRGVARNPFVSPRASAGSDRAAAVAMRSRCPHCLSAVASDDVFCAICGYKIG